MTCMSVKILKEVVMVCCTVLAEESEENHEKQVRI